MKYKAKLTINGIVIGHAVEIELEKDSKISVHVDKFDQYDASKCSAQIIVKTIKTTPEFDKWLKENK